jgi:hypothetical protein
MRVVCAVALRVILCVALCVRRGMASTYCVNAVCEKTRYRISELYCSDCMTNSRVVYTEETSLAVHAGASRCNNRHNSGGYDKHCCTSIDFCLCNPGYYKDGDECKQCLAGTYSNAYGATASTACTPCPAEKWSLAGATSCYQCYHPTFVPTDPPISGYGGFTENGCAVCARGRIRVSNRCDPCGRDTYKDTNDNSCKACLSGSGTEPGEYFDNGCRPCAAGKVSFHASNRVQSSTGVCYNCPAAHYPFQYQSVCEPCPVNTYADPGDAACQPCDDEHYRTGKMTMCCKNNEYWNTQNCQPLQKATLDLDETKSQLTVQGEDVYAGDSGMRRSVPPGYYLNTTNKWKSSSCNAHAIALCTTTFSVLLGCGPIHAIAVDNIVVTYNDSDYTVQDLLTKPDLSLNNIAALSIKRGGACLACSSCEPGEYNSECTAQNGGSPGTCIQCKQSCPNQKFLTHTDPQGCNNTSTQDGNAVIPTSLAQSDYTCSDCKTWRRTGFGRYLLLGGCAGHTVMTRWHPRAEYRDGKLETRECTLGDAASEACYHNAQLIDKAPASPYPSGLDLLRQAYTTALPYCAPGWRVDTSDKCNFLEANRDGTEEWSSACCKRCAVCEYGQKRAADWRACSGFETRDTQRCVDACGVGGYINDGDCKSCRTCHANI